MKLDRRQMIMLGVLVVMLLYLLYDYGVIFPKETTELAQEIEDLTERKDEVDDIAEYAALMVMPEIKWDKNWGADPFFYTKQKKESGEGGLLGIFGSTNDGARVNFDLNGISWLGNSGYALINESILSEGDVIGGYTIEKIAINHVILKQGLKTVRLTLNE